MNLKFCIVISNYYKKIALDLMKGANLELEKYKKVNMLKCKTISIPGVFEIPVTISKLIDEYDAFIALGCVIKGKTPHFNFISKAAVNGIMDLSIKYKKPIGNGIITCLNKKQALERSDPKKKNKGGEAAKAILSVLGISKNDSK